MQHMKRPALQNKRVGVLRMAFRACKVFGSFEKRTPGVAVKKRLNIMRKWPILLAIKRYLFNISGVSMWPVHRALTTLPNRKIAWQCNNSL